MLAELDSILQSFAQLQPADDILQNLTALNPLSFLALDNAGDTLTCSQMLKTMDKADFLNAEEVELQGLIGMDV